MPSVRKYYKTLEQYDGVGAVHEQAVKTAFHEVLQAAAGKEWTLVPEYTPPGKRIRYDGALRDSFGLTLGYWEAKDTADDLDREIRNKINRGYSLQNTIFQDPNRAVLFQDGVEVLDVDLTEPERLREVLRTFLGYHEPEIERFHDAVGEFKKRIPDLAQGLVDKIEEARKADSDFQRAFEAFVETCRDAINPNIRPGAVEEMLVQHLLTERLVRTVFDNSDFRNRNAIAREIESVVNVLTSRHLNRTAFLGQLDRFYTAIEDAARGIQDYAEKQAFLNTVYEQFFQGFSDRVADTHGIVYTPQPLVDFMVRSVDRLLERHFGQTLASEGVHVLDPFVGTGNFLIRVMEQIPAPELPSKYRSELHANEVMLLPYYVASLNIEHTYFDKTGRYEPFEGIVLVDTFEMVEGKTAGMFSAENTARAQRQRESPIKVIIGNPPYNAHQVNANDANQNRKYPIVDGRVSETYAAASKAQNKNALSDPYVKAFRWASDRVGKEGVIAFVTNGSFVSDLAFDGMRRHLAEEFDEIWVIDLGGNVRKNPRLSGTTHNVFGIQVGVAITLLVRSGGRQRRSSRGTIRYVRCGEDWRKEAKYDWLGEARDVDGMDWREIEPNTRHDWLTEGMEEDWERMMPLGDAEEKASEDENTRSIFDQFSRGVETGRDVWVYGFDIDDLASRVERLVDTYNAQVVKWKRRGNPRKRLEDVITFDDQKIKWTRQLLNHLQSGHYIDFVDKRIRSSMYRPYVSKWLYLDQPLVYLPGQFQEYFPSSEADNRVVWLKVGSAWPTFALMVDRPADVLPQSGSQCFPFYVYDTDGTRRENITDWSLEQFRSQYDDASITKWDVFHYVYAVLHHPEYRERYAADLKRTLPRIPFAPEFRPFAEAGKKLAELHVEYETAPEYPLRLVHEPGAPLDYRIEKMKWVDKEKTALQVNDYFRLEGIPTEASEYRLGNRSALDWLVDQYRVKTDKRSGIIHDPNTAFEDDGLIRLLKRVTHISVETVRVVKGLRERDLLVEA